MIKPLIYLDYNATAPIWPEAAAVVGEVMVATAGNPSSVHAAGRAARGKVEKAREALAERLGVRARDIVFTSGGTEANALALCMAGELPVLVSAIEHDSVLAQVPAAEKVPVTPSGVIDLATLEQMIAGRAVFLSLMAVNNETGIVQPVKQAAALVHLNGGRVHCDASQAFGKMPLRTSDLDADFITLSAHKIGGPQGVGALVVTCGYSPQPLLRGGGQELGWRAGTENVAGICGFAAAVAAVHQSDWWQRCAMMRDRLEQRLPAGTAVIPATAARAPNTSLLWMPGVPAATQVMMFDLEGFAVSAGSACSSGKVKPSHVLSAMGQTPTVAGETIRVSLGWQTTDDDIDAFVACWLKIQARQATAMAAE
jgi:cysteine desulfurase